MSQDHSSLDVVILCGGQGTRIREETEFRPKPMVEIGGRPILWHIMKTYAHHGLKNFVLCLGYKGFVIKDFFLNYQARIADVTVRLGEHTQTEFHTTNPEEGWCVTLAETGETAQTGSRVHRIRPYIRGDIFCLTYGDGVGNVDIERLIEFHRSHGKIGTVTGVRPPGRFGELLADGDRVRMFAEKPQVGEGLINGGFFVFNKEFIDRYLSAADDLILEREPLQRLAADDELRVWTHDGFWQPMDTFREWKLLDDMWRGGAAPWKVWS
jgi:glucose-1-phosphate cytidylyltransferase